MISDFLRYCSALEMATPLELRPKRCFVNIIFTEPESAYYGVYNRQLFIFSRFSVV